MPGLQHLDPLGEISVFELTADRLSLGRAEQKDAHIVLSGDGVSRRHAVITYDAERWYLKDLSSRNQTILNDRSITGRGPCVLDDGDRFEICQHRFAFFTDVPPPVFPSESSQEDLLVSSAIALFSDSVPLVNDASIRLSILVEMTRSLQHSLQLDEVLRKTLDSLFQIFPVVDRGVIGMIGADGRYEPLSWRSRNLDEQDEVPVSSSIITAVLERSEAMLFTSPEGQFPNADSVRQLPLTSVICAPLVGADRTVFGILQVDSGRSGCFQEADLELVAAIAVQLSLAITYTRLHDEALKQQVLRYDLANAKQVQRALLPETVPVIPNYEIAAFYEPARTIGGDYYDFFQLGDGRLAIVLADVGGKGISAALYMARLVTETRACLERFSTASELIAHLNRRLQTRFATFVMAVLDTSSHSLTVVNAGHRPPLIRTADGCLKSVGDSVVELPFSILDEQRFHEAEVPFESGESLVMFSDGFEDACDEDTDQRFGVERIKHILQGPGLSAQQTVDALVGAVQDFIGQSSQFDDMCLVALRRR